jgi:hypothetical protein
MTHTPRGENNNNKDKKHNFLYDLIINIIKELVRDGEFVFHSKKKSRT